MGLLIDGVWRDDSFASSASDGSFQRKASAFRRWIGEAEFPAEAYRYHLYVSLACPWAHRALLLRALKGLQDIITCSIVDPFMGDDGWAFSEGPGCVPDTLNGARFLREIYLLADPHYTGRVTVPVLWDKLTGTIVSNESSEIIRMLNREFEPWAKNPVDYYPTALSEEIDELNQQTYHNVNNGVYRCGFARSQDAYEEAFRGLFETLDSLDERLATRRYLLGHEITEADWRLFPTLVRFDPVYFSHFKCNRNRIADYEHLSGYTRDLFQVPGVAETVDLDHIKQHYFRSHESINPLRLVPIGPEIDWLAPHGRGEL